MGHRCRPCPPPLAALAGLLLLLMCVFFFFHSGADARPLPPAPLVLHHHVIGVKDAADDPVLLPEGAAGGNGDRLSISEMVGEAEEACEEGNGDDECVQRRLLRDAHLDYIYTQHKGKP